MRNAKLLLLFFFGSVAALAADPVPNSIDEIKWLSTEGLKLGSRIGDGDYGDVYPISGPGIAPNRVVKLYKWDPEGGTSELNVPDKIFLGYYQGHVRASQALGEQGLRVDGAILWNQSMRGIILERIDSQAERRDWTNGLDSRYVNPRTALEYEGAMNRAREAGLLIPDPHIAIHPDGGIKFYDYDLITYSPGGYDATMRELTRVGLQDLKQGYRKRLCRRVNSSSTDSQSF